MTAFLKKRYAWIIFAVAAIAQFAVPFTAVMQKQDTLKNGAEFKLAARPVDPADAFRGRYVAINIDSEVSEEVILNTPEIQEYLDDYKDFIYTDDGWDFITSRRAVRYWAGGETAYIRLIEGADGFAEIAEISSKPLEGENVLKLRDMNFMFGTDSVRLPFDRYYMKEKAAPEAEAAYNRQNGDAYVTLRVKNGDGVISGLYIDGVRIEDYIS